MIYFVFKLLVMIKKLHEPFAMHQFFKKIIETKSHIFSQKPTHVHRNLPVHHQVEKNSVTIITANLALMPNSDA